MSRKRQEKKRKASKKRKTVKKRPYAVSSDLFRKASKLLMEWVELRIIEKSNNDLCLIRNRGGSGAELARETLISRDLGLANELTDHTIRGAFESYFKGEQTFGEIKCWDVSSVTDMSNMFIGCRKFNSDISRWDVRRVKDMDGMFSLCYSFNVDISGWDVSNVENMGYMFYGCRKFNSDLSGWNVSKVRNMYCMFKDCQEFNSDLSEWDVRNVTYMQSIFYHCNKMVVTNRPNFTNAQ